MSCDLYRFDSIAAWVNGSHRHNGQYSPSLAMLTSLEYRCASPYIPTYGSTSLNETSCGERLCPQRIGDSLTKMDEAGRENTPLRDNTNNSL